MSGLHSADAGFWNYVHSGITVSSELEIPEWVQCEQIATCTTPDVVVRVDPRQQIEPTRITKLIITGEYTISVPEVGHFCVRDGCEILVRPSLAAEPALIRSWLLGPVWGALCCQRGMFIIHASAVRMDGGAVLFCGRAGRGKSTLAAQLAIRGYTLVSDDLCRLEIPTEGPPVVYPSPPRLKLRRDAVRELGWDSKALASDNLRNGKFHLSLTESGERSGRGGALPVLAAYLLSWGEFGVRELHGMDGWLSLFSAATRRPQLLESMGLLGLHSARCVEFLRRVPLFELSRHQDFTASAKTVDFLVDRWSGGKGKELANIRTK